MRPRVRKFLNILGWLAAVVALVMFGGVVAALIAYDRYMERAAKFDLTKIDELPERSEVRDANGEIYSHFGGENRLVVPLSAVSKHFIDALLAREDARFWEHRGVDALGVARALVANIRAGETKQGGSTITQQLARNACELRAKTLDRKALEAVLARRIEEQYTKEQILELYVNRIYFGSGWYGIESAARGYFGKPASELTLGEGAVLAGLIRSPKNLAPTQDLDAALAERNSVLDRMLELGVITADAAAAAKAQQIRLAKRSSTRVADDDIMEAVTRELGTLLAPETIEFGGLCVFITIDPQLQRLAQTVADRRLTEIESRKGYPHPRKADFTPETNAEGEEKPTDYLQAAVVAIENRTGAIRALVGGRDYAHSKYPRASLARRQVGSTFKSFVYAAAFERGMLPGTLVDDSRIASGELPTAKKWSPENADGEYTGLQPAALGLLKSRNTMSVRVGEFAGLAKVRSLAHSVGLSDHVPDLPAIFLGSFETTARALTGAYTVFPNLGVYRAPFLISSVEDRDGRVLYRAPREEKRVISPESAWMVSGILQHVMKSGTAAKAASLGWKKPGAGKTGTTNDFFDAWFVGYTSSLTCGVWVGMDQPETIMEKGYGSALALPIWVDFMKQVPEKAFPSAPFEAPAQLVRFTLCSASGARATSMCVQQRCAYESELPATRVPRELCRTHPEPPPAPVVLAPAPPVAAAPAPATQVAVPTPVPFAVQSTPPPRPLEPVGEMIRQPAPAPDERSRIVHWPAPGGRSGTEPATDMAHEPARRLAPQSRSTLAPQVRRAQPVEPSSREARPVEPPGAMVREVRRIDGRGRVTEQQFVERLPDGRVRTTTVRRIGRTGDD